VNVCSDEEAIGKPPRWRPRGAEAAGHLIRRAKSNADKEVSTVRAVKTVEFGGSSEVN
jgi:hypothetical protein